MKNWRKSVVRQVRTFWSQIKLQGYPLVISFWMAVVFAERLFFLQLTRGRVSGLYTNALIVLTLSWFLILAALLVNHEMLGNVLVKWERIARKLRKELWSPYLWLLVSLTLLAVAISKRSEFGANILMLAKEWVKNVTAHIVPESPIRNVVTGVFVGYAILYFASRLTRTATSSTLEMIQELIVSSIFLLTNAAIYIILCWVLALRQMPDAVGRYELGELFKDTLIYSVIALAIVVGIYKAKQAVRNLDLAIYRWLFFALMAFGAIICAVPALILDMHFKDHILGGASFGYTPAQQDLMGLHIMLRDFGLLVPLVVAAFMKLLLDIEKIGSEPRRLRPRPKTRGAH